MSVVTRILLLSCLIVTSPLAVAHKLAPSLFELQESASGIYDLHWKTPRTLPTPEPIEVYLPEHCVDQQSRQPKPDPVGIVFEWRADCGEQGLVGSTIRFSGLAVNQSAAVIKIDLLDGREYRQLLNGSRPQFLVPERVEWGAVVKDYTLLGVEHILGGIDHLFFVWALVLMLPKRKLLIAITAFTLGHSLTLALAALSFIRVPQEITEFFIALSIFVLAAEVARNRLLGMAGEPGLIERHAFWVCVAFGLLHGLGFAGALRDVGLPQEEVVTALLMFNVGVEIGQILFVCVVILTALGMTAVSRSAVPVMAPSRWVWMPIYLIGGFSTYWCIDRSLGLLI